ncbi:hypothetical protein [Metabacillus sp. Hm71]|uniref:hypothetical protein n=1 Tax=Metabacillus sp. Hm71 TaxID=3450743 RepID=UPI003F423E92
MKIVIEQKPPFVVDGTIRIQVHWCIGLSVSDRKLLSLAFIFFALTDDLVNDVLDRCGGVDYNSVFWNVFFRLVQSSNEFPFRFFSAKFIFWSLVKPPVQCVNVDLEDKHAVK